MIGLTKEQYEALLNDLAESRVATRRQAGTTLSYLEAWDVRRTLIRIFGFGGWSAEVLREELMFADHAEGKWDVGFKVTLKLTIHDLGCHFIESAIAGSKQPSRSEAMDMSLKSAASDALKRCAVNLGTQFGLSLYDDGRKKDVVNRTLVEPGRYEAHEGSPADSERLAQMVEESASKTTLHAVWAEILVNGLEDAITDAGDGLTLREQVLARLEELEPHESE